MRGRGRDVWVSWGNGVGGEGGMIVVGCSKDGAEGSSRPNNQFKLRGVPAFPICK